MRVLVVNAGSSSLKLDLLDGDDVVASEHLEAPGDGIDRDELRRIVDGLGWVDATGHRFVHGGDRFTGPVRIHDDVRHGIAALRDLAPLHQDKALAALDAVTAALPDAPAVACFDTAFHADLPDAARTYALPRAWRERWGLRRYGFHGLSVAHASRRAAELAGRPADELRTVVCHLGSGASVTAVDRGRSVDTTMGFTPLEGLVMATRSGTVDPGLLLWLLRATDLTAPEIERALEHESGLLGLAGTGDVREVEAAADAGDAALALDVAAHRLRAAIAAMAAAMGGLDVLVFTGGVGEHAADVRRRGTAGLEFLGVRLDDGDPNDPEDGGDREITGEDARVRSFVVEAREDLVIAGEVRAVLGG